jgi:hypothetical protein
MPELFFIFLRVDQNSCLFCVCNCYCAFSLYTTTRVFTTSFKLIRFLSSKSFIHTERLSSNLTKLRISPKPGIFIKCIVESVPDPRVNLASECFTCRSSRKKNLCNVLQTETCTGSPRPLNHQVCFGQPGSRAPQN